MPIAWGWVVAVCVVCSLPAPLAAQAFPSRPIRIVVPYPAGGPVDAMARILANELPTALGRPVIVENKPGASGALGTREVARSAPDGHTLVLGTNQTHATNAFLLKEPGYDPIKDFVAVAGIADLQHALVVPKGSVARTTAELISIAKREPGKLNYGSTGAGSASHLTMELFLVRAGISMTHVPFRGAAPLAIELVAGRIDAAFATLPAVLGQIESEDIRPLALASERRAPQLADLVLLKEQGIRNSEGDAWLALFAPSGIPAVALALLETAARSSLEKAGAREGASKVGIAINFRDARSFNAYLVREIAKWGEVVMIAGVKPE